MSTHPLMTMLMTWVLLGSLFVQPVVARMYCGEKDCYGVLGVASDATAGAIRRAYRDLAKQFHPDKNKGPGQAAAAAVFVEVAEAYEVSACILLSLEIFAWW